RTHARSSRELQTAVSHRLTGLTLAMFWRTAASTSCMTTLRWSFQPSLSRPAPAGARLRESVSSIHPAAGGDFSADGSHLAGRDGQLYAIAGIGSAASRLSDHSGAHVLSGSKPDGSGNDGDGAAGAPIWRAAGLEPDDLLQLRRHFGDRAAVQSRWGHRYRRARGAVRHQRGAEFVAFHPA